MSPLEYAAYVFGVSLIIFLVPGQVFFLSINEGIRGLRTGMMMVLGVLTGEFLLVASFAVGFLIVLQRFLGILRIAGAALLLWLGASAINAAVKGSVADPRRTVGTPFSRGLLLTVMNPPSILWLLTIGSTMLDLGRRTLGAISYWIFGLGVLASSTIVTLILVVVTNLGHHVITPLGIRALLLVSGSAFIFLAVIVIIPLLH
jgi:threonine/homoserine/homoserine lactone efflux protein